MDKGLGTIEISDNNSKREVPKTLSNYVSMKSL